MSKGVIYFLTVFVLIIFVVPALLVTLTSNSGTELQAAQDQFKVSKNMPNVKVYLTKEKKVVTIPIEEYVKGVVAAEMPANFHPEALKAQAFSARTYIMDRLLKKDFKDMSRWGEAAKGAVVTDSIKHQVYLTDNQLKEKWGAFFSRNMGKIFRVVKATEGQIITYQGNPIYAAFFSTSNGRTENSEDYFSFKYPYLRSVASQWDKESPDYRKEKEFTVASFIKGIENATGKKIDVSTMSQGKPLLRILQRTDGNRVDKIKIGNQLFTGKEVRTALKLPSSDFTIQSTKKTIKLISKGYGHGVGMSQWGANLMAKSGKKAQEIIRHYYKGVEISSL